MGSDDTAATGAGDRFAGAWHDERGDLLVLAARMLHDPAEAQDVVQEAFHRLALADLDDIGDTRGWLIVVVRRLCLDRIRSARARRETTTGTEPADDDRPTPGGPPSDPADRVTLDDQVQLALAVVLDRLSPAERTVFVLHDVFGFPFASVGEIVGRTPVACRQLASRARRSIRADAPPTPVTPEVRHRREVAERFIAACAGGDLNRLMELLDPEVAGEASVLGRGPLVQLEGRLAVAERLLALFGPRQYLSLAPVEVEGRPGVLVFSPDRVVAVIRLDETDGLIHHIHSFVQLALRG